MIAERKLQNFHLVLFLIISFQYELLFCISDESDPSLMLVKKLIEKYPDVDAQIFIG
jgi:ceramide glucosyltransferase